MSFSTELLQARPEILGRALALEDVKGMAISYVQVRNKGATLRAVDGQATRAKRCGASTDEIGNMIQKAVAAPRADPDRIDALTRRFLQ